jgi:Epoxide hydrolase N terminus
VQLAATQALARYWLDEYDFGRLEARLNALPQFITAIDGVDITHPRQVRARLDGLEYLATRGLAVTDRARRRVASGVRPSSCAGRLAHELGGEVSGECCPGGSAGCGKRVETVAERGAVGDGTYESRGFFEAHVSA